MHQLTLLPQITFLGTIWHWMITNVVAAGVYKTLECLDNECHGLIASNISSLDKVLCMGKNSCQSIKISNVEFVECTGSNSCLYSSINNASSLLCDAKKACRHSNITYINKLRCHNKAACRYTTMKHIQDLRCEKKNSKSVCDDSTFYDVSKIIVQQHTMKRCNFISGNNSTMTIHVKGLLKSIKHSNIYCLNNSICHIKSATVHQNKFICDNTSKMYISADNAITHHVVPFPTQDNCFDWYFSIFPSIPIIVVQVILFYCLESKLYIVNQCIKLLDKTKCSKQFYFNSMGLDLQFNVLTSQESNINISHESKIDDNECEPLINLSNHKHQAPAADNIEPIVDKNKYLSQQKQTILKIIHNIYIAKKNSSLKEILGIRTLIQTKKDSIMLKDDVEMYVWNLFECDIHDIIVNWFFQEISIHVDCNYPREMTSLLLSFCYQTKQLIISDVKSSNTGDGSFLTIIDDNDDKSAENNENESNVSTIYDLNHDYMNGLAMASNYHIITNILPSSIRSLDIYASIVTYYLLLVLFMHVLVFICLNIEFGTWKYNRDGYYTYTAAAGDNTIYNSNIFYKFPRAISPYLSWCLMMMSSHPIYSFRCWIAFGIMFQRYYDTEQFKLNQCINCKFNLYDKKHQNINYLRSKIHNVKKMIGITMLMLLFGGVAVFFPCGLGFTYFGVCTLIVLMIALSLIEFVYQYCKIKHCENFSFDHYILTGVQWPPKFDNTESNSIKIFDNDPKFGKLFVFVIITVCKCLVFSAVCRLFVTCSLYQGVDVLAQGNDNFEYFSTLVYPYTQQICSNNNQLQAFWPIDVNLTTIIVWFSWWIV